DPRQLPRVVLRSSVGDDVPGDVLDDQIVAPHAHRGLQAERQRAWIPPYDRVAVREVVLARTHGACGRCLVVRPLQDGVFRLEDWTFRTARRAPSLAQRWVQRSVERAKPSTVP